MLSKTNLGADVKRVEEYVGGSVLIDILSEGKLRTDWQQQPVVLQTSYAEVGVREECDGRSRAVLSVELLGGVECGGALAWQWQP
jgi:hypothetical protein